MEGISSMNFLVLTKSAWADASELTEGSQNELNIANHFLPLKTMEYKFRSSSKQCPLRSDELAPFDFDTHINYV